MKKELQNILQSALQSLQISQNDISLSIPQERKHGDFASPIALQLAKELKRSPLDIAKEIEQAIPKNDIIEKIEIVPPGFINFFLKDSFVIQSFFERKEEKITIGKGKTIVTDTSHPNVAKPMGIHHLLSTIIGASLNNIFSFCGYNVVKDNFIGDYGTQFGKLIYAYKTWGDKKKIEKNPIPELLELYVYFHNEAEKNPILDNKGRDEFKKLEEGDAENKALWQWIVDISLQEFLQIYKRLNISFDIMHGESFYEDKMASILELGKEKNVFVEGEKGAFIVHFEDEKLSTCVIQKSDGTTMYHTRDLARIDYWEKTYHPEMMINVVDVAQELYFKQLFAINDLLELTKSKNIHISFGRMQFKDAKMSTRKGNIILLEEVLDEAIERSQKLIQTKESILSEKEQKKLAEIMGIGAVKYIILSQNRTTNIVFDWDKMISLEGNSAPYLQYTYARGKSILKKQEQEKTKELPSMLEPLEKELILKIGQFHEVVIESCKTFKPNLIANYLYELAQLFNSFYNKYPVLKAEIEKRKLRLKLIESFCTILQVGLNLLGIEVPERM